MIRMPDLLHLEPRLSVDRENLSEILDLAFLGKDTGNRIDQTLSLGSEGGEGWDPQLFATDLFVRNLIRQTFTIVFDGVKYNTNEDYLFRVLTQPPRDLETIRFRQEVLRELMEDGELRTTTEQLYRDMSLLLSSFKVPDHVARLDINAHRLELLKQTKAVIDSMVRGFATARSGLRRLHEAGLEIQASEEYNIVSSLLDYEQNFLQLNVNLSLGPEGRVRDLRIERITENEGNRFYLPAWKRFFARIRLFVWNGVLTSNREIVNRLLHEVFRKITPSLVPLFELMCHMEVYLTALRFREKAAEHGLEVSLAEFTDTAPLSARQAFNPLLFQQEKPPVPTNVRRGERWGTTLVTGPNSGGKTRLLQTLGLVQLLGQAGVFVPAAQAELPLLQGMFVSLIESEAADHAEGRLGREMMRIRSLFEGLSSPAMVMLDELCSGTNPSEGTETFSLVLELLDRLGTTAFISTHFLDFAQHLQEEPPVAGLEFLQVEIDEQQNSTYQFLPGVAQTSLAAVTAERLGVTFDQLTELIDRRRSSSDAMPAHDTYSPSQAVCRP